MLSGKLKAAWPEAAPPSSSIILKFDTSKGTSGTTVGVNLGGTVNVVIDWGDGTPPEAVTTAGYPTHTYATGGIYDVSISGSLTQLGGTTTTYQAKLVECVSFGDGMGLTSLARALSFTSVSNLVPTSIPSTVTDINRMFLSSPQFNGDISGWDTSAVTNMERVFQSATSFNQNISSWNTSAVTNMTNMFNNAASFNQNISSWDTSAVTNMVAMFMNAASFNGDISGWDTSAVTNMTDMFNSATSFNQDISGWDTAAVTIMTGMFWSALNFNQDISGWNTSAVTDMSDMFLGATSFNQNISLWDTSAVTNMMGMFDGAIAFNQNISSWDTSAVTNMVAMFQNATSFNGDISSWNTASVTNMALMFQNATSFNGDISSWDTSAVTIMEAMFLNATSFNQDISGWDTAAVTIMVEMLQNATSFNQDLSSWCVGNILAQPTNFDSGATAYVLPRPVWGTCPLYYTTDTVDLIGSATGTNTVASLPAHVAGDVILCFAFRDGSTAAPSSVSGWRQISTRTGTLCSARLSYRVATDSATLPGTWTSATSVVFVIYRGVTNPAELAITYVYQAGAVEPVTYPANAYWSGLSKVVSFAGHRSTNTNLEIPPTGLDLIVNVVDASDESAAFNSSSSTYAAWPSTDVAVGGTASGWITAVLRLRPPIVK